MLKLVINGESLDLLPGASISIDEESPVFDKDSIPGGFSFPFALPITPKNSRILGFPERLEKAGEMSTELPFRLYHTGRLRATGTISVTEASENYKATLFIHSGDFASKISGKSLKDLDLGGSRSWVWKTEYKFPEDDFALAPVFNSLFFAETQYAQFFADYYYRVNAFEAGAFYQMAGNVPYAVCPFPFLSYILRQIFYFAGYNVIENVFTTDPDLRDMVLYTIRDINKVELVYTSTLLFLGNDEFGNPLTRTVFSASENRSIDTFNLADSMPAITIAEFMLSLRNLLNIAFIIEDDAVRIIKRQDLLHSASVIDITNQASPMPTVLGVKSDGIKLEWQVDPEDLLWAEYNFKNLDDFLQFLKPPLATLDDLSALQPEANEIRFVSEVNIYFRYEYFAYDPEDVTKFRWQWVSWSFNYQNYRQGNAAEVFTTKFAPILTVSSHHNPASGLMRAPFVEQKGAFHGQDQEPPFAPRLLFYRGLISDSLGANYPYATNDNLDRVGAVLPGKSLSLCFEGEFGIYAQLWSRYITWWLQRKQVTWQIEDPSLLSFGQKYAINGCHYLLKNRRVNLGVNSINPEDCEFYMV